MSDRDREERAGDVKVTDHRRFAENGSERKDAEPAHAEEKHAEHAPNLKGEAPKELPQIDFVTFILSLATSAQVHLGAVPNPTTGKSEKDVVAAKQTIDILGIMQDKTKGNLSAEEERLLEHVLFDLRMMYVEATKK